MSVHSCSVRSWRKASVPETSLSRVVVCVVCCADCACCACCVCRCLFVCLCVFAFVCVGVCVLYCRSLQGVQGRTQALYNATHCCGPVTFASAFALGPLVKNFPCGCFVGLELNFSADDVDCSDVIPAQAAVQPAKIGHTGQGRMPAKACPGLVPFCCGASWTTSGWSPSTAHALRTPPAPTLVVPALPPPARQRHGKALPPMLPSLQPQ